MAKVEIAPSLFQEIQKKFKGKSHQIIDLLETLEIGSLCMLGGGLPLPVKNALHYFGDELKVYFRN